MGPVTPVVKSRMRTLTLDYRRYYWRTCSSIASGIKAIALAITSSPLGAEYFHPAFVNHLLFLACHRGTVEIGPDGVHVRSDIEGFSCWSPVHQEGVIPVDAGAVRINSYNESNWVETLRPAGYLSAETIRYMQRATGALPPTELLPRNCVTIARSDADARVFARVQLDGFIQPDAANRTRWGAIFEAVACKVWGRRDHRLYIFRQFGIPVAVGMIVCAAGIAGLYQNGRGVSGRRSDHVLSRDAAQTGLGE
jgi:hypothetical protein